MAQPRATRSRAYLSAGLDEAGLGPLLGPFALGCVVLEGTPRARDPWHALSDVVAERRAEPETRLVVADSKHVYDRTSAGARELERVALAFAAQWDEGPLARGAAHPWSDAPDAAWADALPRTLPLWNEPARIAADRAQLAAALARARLRVRRASVRLVPERALNAAFDAHGNKSRAIWSFVRPELRRVWDECGERAPRVVLDRQGGRTHYAALLAALFPEARLAVEHEQAELCAYELCDEQADTLYAERGARRMSVYVRPRAEQSSFETALASCLAKYAREVCMHAFNAYFARYEPSLRPTAGYVEDGRRWLVDAATCLQRAGVEPAHLMRTR